MCGSVLRDIGRAFTGAVKAIVPIAAPIAGYVLGGPWGAAIGSSMASLAAGKSPGQALSAGALGWLGGSLAQGFGIAGGQGFDSSMASIAGGGGGAASGGALLGPPSIVASEAVGIVPGLGPVDALGFPVGGGGAGGVLASTAAGGSFGRFAPGAFDIASGLFGMGQAGEMQDLSRQAAKAGDPFGPYRKQYASQLSALLADPSLITKLPGYQFGMEQGQIALERQMAQRGLTGSGREAIELQRYGQDYAQKFLAAEQQRLANLAGAGIVPNYAPALQGYGAGADIWSQSLRALGYGAGQLARA